MTKYTCFKVQLVEFTQIIRSLEKSYLTLKVRNLQKILKYSSDKVRVIKNKPIIELLRTMSILLSRKYSFFSVSLHPT